MITNNQRCQVYESTFVPDEDVATEEDFMLEQIASDEVQYYYHCHYHDYIHYHYHYATIPTITITFSC